MILLHREKTAAYGTAWKKRGEVLSILANMARKVDRIEFIQSGGTATHDEPMFDTYLDLLIYAVKYETFLADTEAAIAAKLFPGESSVTLLSEGTAGFDHLVQKLDLSSFDANDDRPAADYQTIIDAFAKLESCFDGLQMTHSPSTRLERVMHLIDAVTTSLAALARSDDKRFDAFVAEIEESAAHD